MKNQREAAVTTAESTAEYAAAVAQGIAAYLSQRRGSAEWRAHRSPG
jgi:hypothetical protein